MSNDSEARYLCTLYRAGKAPVRLMVPRTPSEIEQLRRKGYVVETEANATNEKKPNVFSKALVALSELYSYAEATGDVELQGRTGTAMQALFSNSGLSSSVEEPTSSTRLKTASMTLPGIGRR